MIKVYGEDKEKICSQTAKKVLKFFDISESDIDIEINIVDSETIRELNKENRDIDSVTDVLSFPCVEVSLPLIKSDYADIDKNPETGSVILGEIDICLERATEQAEEYGHSIEREITFLCSHGCLHLLGYDHIEPDDEKEMLDIQEQIIGSREDSMIDIDTTEEKKDFKSGMVTVIGRPNAGKSTLINRIVGEKVAIVSWKPQTTRNKIKGIYNDKNTQIVFIDTPGLHTPRNTLGEFMMKAAKSALEGVDSIVYVIDAEKGISEKDIENIVQFVSSQKVIVAVNKIDHVTKEAQIAILTRLTKVDNLQAVVPISALRDRNINHLIDEIKKTLTDTVCFYPQDMYVDRDMRFIVSEIVREKALRLLDKEIPFGIGVIVTKYQAQENGVIAIDVDIVCEKKAHKPIILGKGGAMVKKISTYARQDLEEIIGAKVFLSVWVKVKEDWRSDESVMRELGYDKKKTE